MKNTIIVPILLLWVSTLSAQWTVGPKAYLGVITQAPAEIEVMPMSDYNVYRLDYTGSSSVKSVGFMAFNDIGPIYLQAEFLGTMYRLDFMLSGYKSMNDGGHLFREEFYVFEFPVNAGLRIGNFKLGLGPVVEINLDTDSEMSLLEDYESHIRPVDYSFQAMAGYNIGVLHIDIKYVNKFASIVDGFSLGNDIMRFNRSANRFMFGLGVSF